MSEATLAAPTPEATAASIERAGGVAASVAAPALAERPAKRPRVADEAPSNPEAKRKVALLLAYNGAQFQGLQKNPGATTVEQALEDAIHACGGISDANYEAGYQKVSWSRAGRTDKGVHAVGQLIGLKMVLHNDDADPDPMVARVNAELARGAHAVRILAVARATNGFCAHSGCSSREYEYLLPACALRPAGSAHGDGTTAPTAAELERLRGLLAKLEGTHSFHNLSDGKLTPGDKQAQRYIKGTSVGEPVRVAAAGSDAVDATDAADGVGEAAYFVPVRFHGQSFLLHQIRKMVALIVAVARGDAPEAAIHHHLTAARAGRALPLAPGCALTLRRCWYEQYERRRPADKPSLHFDDAAVAAQDAFLNEHIRPHIAARERAGEFREWLAAIEGHAWEAEVQVAPPTETAPSAVELANSDV